VSESSTLYRALGTNEFGSGLGLSIVKTIADRIGGGVSVGQSGSGGLQVAVSIPRSLICLASG
jgi:two-component system, OmpR family, sensor kinase